MMWWVVPAVLAAAILVGVYGVVNFVAGFLDERSNLSTRSTLPPGGGRSDDPGR